MSAAPRGSDSTRTRPAVEVRHLGVQYGRRWAVSEVSFDVTDGSFTALVGKNGAGKTTVLKTVMTLLPPARGSVTVRGHDVVREPVDVRAQTGYVPQMLSVDATLTAREHLVLFARLRGIPRRERRGLIDHLLTLALLDKDADRPLREFSGGMVRRVEIAQAILARPKLLVVDEPTGGLDPAAREAVWAQLDLLRSEMGTTLLFTTHSLEEVDQHAERIVVMRAGTIAGVGDRDGIKSIDGRLSNLRDLLQSNDDDGRDSDSMEDSGAFSRLRQSRTADRRRK